MTIHDDSNSDSDVSLYEKTKVLLGYASNEATDDTISIIGGQPAWLDEESPPSVALARCSVCHDVMVQLLQLHADLPEEFPTHERRLHVFACRRRTCTRKLGSIRAVRTSRASTIEATPISAADPFRTAAIPPETQPTRDLGGSIFGGGNKLFGAPPPAISSPSTNATDLPTSFASKARIVSDAPTATVTPTAPLSFEPWPESASLPKPYPQSYLDAGYEELDADFRRNPAAGTASITIEAPATDEGGEAEAALAESNLDRTFQRFSDRLAQNPEQVLRYEFRGTPLLYSKTDATGKLFSHVHEEPASKVRVAHSTSDGVMVIPACPRCGSRRVFEVQLVPHAIMELEAEDETNPAARPDTSLTSMALEGMEWATILVGVCSRDCAGQPNACVHVEEWVGVQWEEQRQQ